MNQNQRCTSCRYLVVYQILKVSNLFPPLYSGPAVAQNWDQGRRWAGASMDRGKTGRPGATGMKYLLSEVANGYHH